MWNANDEIENELQVKNIEIENLWNELDNHKE